MSANTKPNFAPNHLRREILRMAYHGNSVHIGCAFSLVEIVSVLCGEVLRLPFGDAASEPRDRLILSKGHGAMALYVALAELNWISASDIDSYFKDGSALHGLCEAKTPGVEVCSGSLGHGLPVAVGMAWAHKRMGRSTRFVCIVGDGEMHEGPMWEAILFAAHHQLSNLTVIVDANGHQAMGRVEDVIGMEPMPAKFSAFGWAASDCDGHDAKALKSALMQPTEKPHAIVARTRKGKGVSFMEDNNEWHYRRLNPEIYERALAELKDA